MKGFIVYSTHKVIDEKTYINLFGKLENGESFVAILPFKPYFFIKEKDLKKVTPLLKNYKVEKTKLRNFSEDKVIKISSKNPVELRKLSSFIHKKEIDTYEADLKPASRYLIDKDILGTLEISGDYEISEKINRVYSNPKITPISTEKYKLNLKTISLDIESDKHTGEVFCIGLHGKEYQKCFIISEKPVENAISCKDEHDLLTKFRQEIIDADPDIITGWHVIDFDLALLRTRFIKNKINFDIGRNNDNPRIKIDQNYFRASSADVPGRQILDALNMIKDPFIKEAPSIKTAKFNSYTLEDVSQVILGEGKILKGKSRHEEISDLFKKDKNKLVKYNLKDAELAYKILEKTKMIELAIERALLTGMHLNKITASIAAFDSLYIREARKRGLVSPTTRYKQKSERIKGGYVMDSTPGIYKNVLVLDFKSLYPSVMKTFNIDPASHLKKKQKGSIESPNKTYFKNQSGILPDIIETLHKAREKAKKEKRELSSYSIKIIMNSFWGVLASENCRYFNLDMGNAITSFSRWAIQTTAKKIEEMGHKVIYSDTDSVFIESKTSKKEAKKIGKDIEKSINKFFEKHIKKKFSRKSYLELELEKLYIAFMMPPIRGSDKGSKKRYAGLLENPDGSEKIQIVGLEAIRGDWTEAAQEFQIELLTKIFHKEEFSKFIKDYVKKILSGDLDEKLIYKKSITKPLEEYTKTTPPHVKAARKLDKLDSRIIKYYVTIKGPEPLQKLKHKLDYEHYIKKQIAPIANTLLFFFDKTFEEIIQTSKQTKLF